VPGSGRGRYAVKELFWESDEESVRPEVTITAHLESAGIRLPGSLPGRDGRFLQELAADHGGGWLRLYRWIDGVPVDLADRGWPSRSATWPDVCMLCLVGGARSTLV
jgi:Ser/Thr protein kinase RdoA (MazF antagonist)